MRTFYNFSWIKTTNEEGGEKKNRREKSSRWNLEGRKKKSREKKDVRAAAVGVEKKRQEIRKKKLRATRNASCTNFSPPVLDMAPY
jgi:hypothetical protein